MATSVGALNVVLKDHRRCAISYQTSWENSRGSWPGCPWDHGSHPKNPTGPDVDRIWCKISALTMRWASICRFRFWSRRCNRWCREKMSWFCSVIVWRQVVSSLIRVRTWRPLTSDKCNSRFFRINFSSHLSNSNPIQSNSFNPSESE